jgi:hypothetical protein
VSLFLILEYKNLEYKNLENNSTATIVNSSSTKTIGYYTKFINNKDLSSNGDVCNQLMSSDFMSNVNECFCCAFKAFDEDLGELNEIEEALKLARGRYEENGMQKNFPSDTEDGYKSCGSSISDKTYMIKDLERKKSRRLPSVSIDLIDIENKKI